MYFLQYLRTVEFISGETMSPRPKKPRNCSCPYRAKYAQVYKPAGIPLSQLEVISLDHDELEALFLCDAQDMTQEQAGNRMGVSRGTVQRLLAQGRKKMIQAVVQVKALAIGEAAGEAETLQ